MDKSLAVIFMAIFLVLGFVCGAVFVPGDEVIKEVEVEVIKNVSVETIVEIAAPSQLDLAKYAFLKAVEDEEDEAGNDVDVLGSYDYDEIEVSKVYDEYSVEYDDDETTVSFSIKLRFDEDGERSEKETFDVIVRFEEGEDTEVEVA